MFLLGYVEWFMIKGITRNEGDNYDNKEVINDILKVTMSNGVWSYDNDSLNCRSANWNCKLLLHNAMNGCKFYIQECTRV